MGTICCWLSTAAGFEGRPRMYNIKPDHPTAPPQAPLGYPVDFYNPCCRSEKSATQLRLEICFLDMPGCDQHPGR